MYAVGVTVMISLKILYKRQVILVDAGQRAAVVIIVVGVVSAGSGGKSYGAFGSVGIICFTVAVGIGVNYLHLDAGLAF
ncbi:hypothetical protein SDC9_85817 [bioreactor metagenome]|uniref:Uncharacterized protein n=1 Tax=bioreactor metagenome TaxID=1076179 RepID=A0A644ZN77_9ZZZZ